MSLDFSLSLGVRPAFATHIEDAFHGAQVDYCYEDFSPVAESFNVPALPAWAIVTACYTFESASRPGLYHVAVTFKGLVSLPEKQITYCGCDAAQHERICWHVRCCEDFEDAVQVATPAPVGLVDDDPFGDLNWPEEMQLTPRPTPAPQVQPYKAGDEVRGTNPRTGKHVDGTISHFISGGEFAVVRYYDARLGKWDSAAYSIANITPRVAAAKAA